MLISEQQNEQFSWKTRFRELAEGLGFIKVGFTGAQPLKELALYLEESINEGYVTPFVPTDITLRTNPQAVWPECKTVAVLAYPLPLTAQPQANEAVLSRSAVGEDYHRVLRIKLEELSQKLLEAGWPSNNIRLQVDTGPLNERGFALRSGVGWLGNNQQLIIPGVGSFVALALLLLDQELPPDEPIANLCGTCQNCIRACPARLLGKKYFNASQCLSYLTQTKERLTGKQAESLGRRLFGCDTCQEVCPHNQGVIRREEETKTKAEVMSRGVDPYQVLIMTKAEFNERFRKTAAGWRGKGILQRNAYRIMENLQDERRISWLKENKSKK